MRRESAAFVLLVLHAHGYTITAATLRQWVKRGHITRGPGGYCIREVREYLDRRESRDTPAA